MLGTIFNVGIDCLTATVSQTRIPVEERCAGLISEKKAVRLAKNTGFTRLSVVPSGVCTSDLCVEAAGRLFADGANKDEIGAIVFVSQTPDYPAPATSYIIQNRLDLPTNIMAFDISLGCSGFVYGIYVAASMLSNMNKKILLLVGDIVQDFLPGTITGRAINGAAGAAAIIGHRPPELGRRLDYNITSHGDKYHILMMPRGGGRAPKITNAKGELLPIEDNFSVMDGAEVMNFSAYETYDNICALLQSIVLDENDIEVAYLHQANLAIVDALREKLGLSESKVPFASGEVGNTSSATIPVCMAELKRLGKYKSAKKVLLSGFGIGMSVATMVMDLSETKVLETGEL